MIVSLVDKSEDFPITDKGLNTLLSKGYSVSKSDPQKVGKSRTQTPTSETKSTKANE